MSARAVVRIVVAALALSWLVPEPAEARVGGGHSYSGSRGGGFRSSSRSYSSRSFGTSSHSSGPSRPATPLETAVTFAVLLVIAVIVIAAKRAERRETFVSQHGGADDVDAAAVAAPTRRAPVADRVRQLDPTFSEPVFLEWLTLLYARAFEAIGQGDHEVLRPYFEPGSVDALRGREVLSAARGVSDIHGVVVGSAQLQQVRADTKHVTVRVAFHANYTVVPKDGAARGVYVHETWTLRRARTAQSRVPDDVDKLGCPHCMSPIERTSLDRCAHCNNPYVPGREDWCVAAVELAERQLRGPLLTGTVEEVGTDFPTVVSTTLAADKQRLAQSDPAFAWPRFEARARHIFVTLQAAWSALDWQKLRAFETESVFQTHRFWLEEYKRQGLRNRLDDVRLGKVHVVKVAQDAHYDAITCRMHASARDSTVNERTGKVVGGNPYQPRVFTEYWTFLRRRGYAPKKEGAADTACPSCGAPLSVNAAGVCEYCQTKITRGQFDWVLTRIEQDEEYTG